jgi:hypothetical protein
MLGEKIQSADWKTEKHVPVIDCPDQVKAGEVFVVTATIGKEILMGFLGSALTCTVSLLLLALAIAGVRYRPIGRPVPFAVSG